MPDDKPEDTAPTMPEVPDEAAAPEEVPPEEAEVTSAGGITIPPAGAGDGTADDEE